MVWFSIPCTGGSRWQIVHLHRGGQAAVDRINQHIALMRRLWNQAKKLITHAHNVGASWVVEWPHSCQYWRGKCVTGFLKHHPHQCVVVDGCMLGLVARRQSHAGVPMKKRWRLVSNSSAFVNSMAKDTKCTHAPHAHAAVEGPDTKPTEGYTDAFAAKVMLAWMAQRNWVSPRRYK